jgi:hypothetical protein
MAAVVATGAALLAISLTWLHSSGSRLTGWARAVVAVSTLAMVIVAGWSALYAASLRDPVIPVLDWTWPAVATGTAACAVGRRYGVRAGLAGGLIAVAPVAALDGLGWSLHDGGAISALGMVLVLDGFGIILGSLLALTGSTRR